MSSISSSKNSINVTRLAVIELVSPETRDVLRVAACLGDNNFSLVLLSRVMNLGIFEVARRIWPAQQIGLISSDQSLQVHSNPRIMFM
jgi:predicted ATPase